MVDDAYIKLNSVNINIFMKMQYKVTVETTNLSNYNLLIIISDTHFEGKLQI